MPPRPTRVTFTPALESVLRSLARLMNEPKEAAGVRSRMVDPATDDREGSWIQVRSEYAVAEMLGVEMQAGAWLHGDGGVHDLVAPDGRTVQVKFSKHRTGRFALPHYEPALRADLGVLVVTAGPAEPHAVIVVGYVTRDRFTALARRVELQQGAQLVVDQADLEPVQDLRR